MQSVADRVDAERAEVDLVLNSKTVSRSSSLGRFLSFVCEKYFEGATSEIKEYSIAVQALGRPRDFDPQVDTVVRVTAHNLRKRLELYYASEGGDHLVQISLPPGHYIPQFIHRDAGGANGRELRGVEPTDFDILTEQETRESIQSEAVQVIPGNAGQAHAAAGPKLRIALIATVIASLIVTLSLYIWVRKSPAKQAVQSISGALPSIAVSGPQILALVGNDRAPYLDRAGLSWQSDRFCSGGNTFSITGHTILGTDDSELFSSGRHGTFKCSYPAPPGVYEVHLLFAETAGLKEASRNVSFSINGAAPQNLDVVDDAGGDDIATTKIYTDVEPAKDGMIQIDFSSPESFVNAIQIIPGLPHRMLPARIVTGHSAYGDAEGNLWLPDRNFFGGRLSSYVGDLTKVPDRGLYEWHRFGHFHYVIPVATGTRYTLKLYFLEHWFGVQNGGIGGIGSRLFDVSCNGSTLLKSFDIYGEAGSGPLVKSFPHIQPTAQGKIELYFTPVVNYPSVSAIEVIPE